MKVIKIITSGIFTLLLSFTLSAQNPPDPPDEHGSDEDQPGGDAPVGSAQMLLLGFAAVYGSRKVYFLKTTDSKKPDDFQQSPGINYD